MAAADFLPETGEAAALIREFDWASTPLGPIGGWPQSLKTITGFLLRSPIPIVLLWGEDGVMIYNDAYSVFAGRRHPQLLGSNVREGWPEVADFNDNVMRVGLAGGTLAYRSLELTLDRRRGPEPAWMDLDYSPVLDESGQPGGVIAIVVDTTERVLAERRQADAVTRQRRQFEQAPGFIIVMDGPEHRVEFVNDTHRQVFGSDDWPGRTIRDAFPSIAGQGFYETLDKVYETGVAVAFDNELVRYRRTPGGPEEQRYLTFIYAPTTDETGKVTGIFCDGFDVTDSHHAQTALRESERRLRFLDDLARETGKLSDADAILRATTRMVGEHLGISICAYADMDDDGDGFTIRGDWAGPGSQSIVGHYSLAAFGKAAVKNLNGGAALVVNDNRAELSADEAATFQSIGILATICMPLVKEGRLSALMAIHDKTPRVWSAYELALIREVAERSWAHVERVGVEADLRASEANFRTLARAMPNQVWTARPDGRLDWFNDEVYAFSGAQPGSLDSDGWMRIIHPDDQHATTELWAGALTAGRAYRAEFRVRRADGAWRWHIARAAPVRGEFGQVLRWVGSNSEIHDQKEAAATLEQRVEERTAQLLQAEDALRQSQKMEAVGQLTGGIAHDFNNLLAGISGGLEMLEKRIAEGRASEAGRYIDLVQASTRRAAALTQRLLAFSRRQTLDPTPTDVNRLVSEMLELARRTVGPGVFVETRLADDLWPAEIDTSQLENALLNLVINARDAMPEGGCIRIVTTNVELDAEAARERELTPGAYLCLAVSDSGAGMTPEVARRAFDPFFTTKPLGQGTGLGLSMIHGFVRQSGGEVTIETAPGEGTTIRLHLPRYEGDLEPAAPAETVRPRDEETGDGETVLVIDDEAAVRALMTETLREAGYRVLEAPDGPAGLAILGGDRPIDLLVTDVGLPGGINGRQVADAARLRRPGLKVLFVTGYAETAAIGGGRMEAGMRVITKPFPMGAFGTRVREMLDG